MIGGRRSSRRPAAGARSATGAIALVLARGEAPAGDGYRGFVTALEIHLNLDHGGLPAGTVIAIGYAEAAATRPGGRETRRRRPPPPVAGRPSSARRRRRCLPGSKAPGRPAPLPTVEPKLTKGGYVFPVHGPASFVDTFGAGRAVVGWHHGEDIFAPMGAPLLAVADGTLFSVGWNDIGGLRLWLRDTKGTSSTTRTCPRSRRSRSTARESGRAT